MIAVPETVRGRGEDTLIWHKPVGRVVEEFQAIACRSDEGIIMPSPKQNVSLSLGKPGERWCPDCLNRTAP
ncbi:hypothetical protein [Streptomyces sp. ALI-76-A]|uniref:hypothetical protein n=1 Tax=Streptomyces sp. ALI-76-A TaxID=3025736 RepID=UPI00256EDAB9|nr:hypothetical protein [Streptomyces sp. ALI-76-A]MDL5199646.1 hypothetical protein [Streptomyces sp. ALI-76-A]